MLMGILSNKPYFYGMILVTGGTGLVGAHLLYALLKKHDRIRATHRATSDLEDVKKVFSFYTNDTQSLYNRIDWAVANIIDVPALTPAFEGVTTVYHCAAFISFNPKHYHILKKTNVEGTANIVNLCLDYKIEKLCYVSSVATLGNTLDGGLIDEETDWDPELKNSVYAITKFGAEMEVWRGIQEGLAAVIVNPGIILGEWFWNSGSGSLIKSAAKGSKYYTNGSSGFVDVCDVVTVMITLMEGPFRDQRYILVSENVTYHDFLSQLAMHFNQKPPSKSIRKNTLLLLSSLDWLAHLLFRSKRKLLRPIVEAMFTETLYNHSKVLSELNFKFKPLEETLARVTKNYSSSSTGSAN